MPPTTPTLKAPHQAQAVAEQSHSSHQQTQAATPQLVQRLSISLHVIQRNNNVYMLPLETCQFNDNNLLLTTRMRVLVAHRLSIRVTHVLIENLNLQL